MEQKNNMATAALVMGIIAIVTSCCCCMGFVFGGLAITFALLSRTDRGFEGHAKAGLITGIIGMVLSVISIIIWALILSMSAMEGLGGDLYGWLPGIQGVLRGGFL